MPELIGYVDKELRPHGYNVQNARASYCPLYIASFFNAHLAFILPFIGYDITTDWQTAAELLGLDLKRSYQEIMVDMVNGMIDQGMIKDLRKKK